MIKKINIRNFKSIENIELELERINVLVGGNNSGKTSILQAMQFGGSVIQTIEITSSIPWRIKRDYSRSIEPNELVYSPLKDVSALARGGELKQGEKHNIHINYSDDKLGDANVTIKRGKNRNIVATINKSQLCKELKSIESPTFIFVPGLSGIPYNEQFKTESIVRKAAARGDANGVLRNILWILNQENSGKEWPVFMDELKMVFNNIDIIIRFNPKTDEYIDVKVKEIIKKIDDTGNEISIERILPLDAVGTGVLQSIQILSYINLYHPKVLILDEPDAHLHPDNQRKIINMVIELAEKKDYQLIISTHSRHIIDSMQDKAKITWIKKGDRVAEDDYDFLRMLMDLGALDTGDKLKNGLIKCVVLTEDSTDLEMIKTLLSSSGFYLNETDIWSYNGCTKIDAALILAEFIKKHAPSVKILIHRDRDYLTDDEINKYKNKILDKIQYCFITKGTDIESYFLNSKYIQSIYPSLNSETCEKLLSDSTEKRKENSIRKFINARNRIEQENNRKSKSKNEIDVGELALKCQDQYNKDQLRYRHGKTVFAELKNQLQNEAKVDIRLIIKDNINLYDDELKKIAAEIWDCKQ